jgi:hypothetical protein
MVCCQLSRSHVQQLHGRVIGRFRFDRSEGHVALDGPGGRIGGRLAMVVVDLVKGCAADVPISTCRHIVINSPLSVRTLLCCQL